MNGKVWLVGAGPGDPGLFTRKGQQVLETADVVVYDALVGQGVLQMIPGKAEKINVGKRSANHLMPQEDINRLLADLALEGKNVVRLKGGDPFLFGRGGEELELLSASGIPYEIVPGITSAIAVPAFNGIPLTHRDYCSSVHIITGHKRKGASYDIDFEALVRTRGTLVFLMGLAALPDIVHGLLNAGMRPDMPAAVLSQGTTSGQKRVTAPLKELAEKTEKAALPAPAIIVVGEVCTLAGTFAWAEKKPLFGRKILVTRPAQLISAMAEKLRQQGAEVLELPAIRTVPVSADPAASGSPLSDALDSISRKGAFDWIVFTSPTGVQVFMKELCDHYDVRLLSGSKIAAIGSGTAKELKKYALHADMIPSVYDGDTLGLELARLLSPGMRVLIPRAAIGNRELTEHLQAVPDIEILDIPTYDTLYEKSELIDETAEFNEGRIDYVVFTSASTVRGFAEATKGLDYSKVRAVCIGRQTRAAADALGMQTYMSEKAAMDSVVEKVIELCRADTDANTGRC